MDNVILRASSGDEVELGTVDDILEHVGCDHNNDGHLASNKERRAMYIAMKLAEAVSELIDDLDPDAEISITVQ
jgi:hypothetical protein